MIDVLLTIFWGVLLLCLVVVIHEGGHFLAARAFGVRVLEFMIGLPGPRIGVRPKNSRTRFGVTAIPLGGYARIAGMDEYADQTHFAQVASVLYEMGSMTTDEAEQASEQVGFDIVETLDALCEWGTVESTKLKGGSKLYQAPAVNGYELGQPRKLENPQAFIAAERKETYIALPCWKRIVVLFAGPGANLLTAIIAVTLILSLIGTTTASTTLSEVSEQYPAYAAGLRAGDTITAVDGVATPTWSDFTTAMSGVNPGETVNITYERNGEQTTVAVQAIDNAGRTIVGVTAGTQRVTMSMGDAFKESIDYIGQVTVAILQLVNPATTMQTVSQSTSVVGISVVAKQAADLGVVNFIWLIALISISIGLMNLLPLLPLDGGRIVIELIQRVSRRVMSLRFMNGYSMLGMGLVLLLFMVVTTQDIGNIASGAFPW